MLGENESRSVVSGSLWPHGLYSPWNFPGQNTGVGSLPLFLSLSFFICVLSPVWLFATPVDCSPPGSSVHGIHQARTLEWVAISSSRGSSWPRDWTQVSCITGGFFYHRTTRESQVRAMSYLITKERTRKYNFWAFYYEKHFVRDTYIQIYNILC